MALETETRKLFAFLRQNRAVRDRIAAPPNATILYSGQILKPAWKEVADMKHKYPALSARKTLPEVLAKIGLTGQPYGNLLEWAQSLDSIPPWRDNGFIVWRALSGIFASNAVGTVSFVIGSGISHNDKVFAATEVPVLLRNSRLDPMTRDLLEYYRRCIAQRKSDIGVSFIPA